MTLTLAPQATRSCTKCDQSKPLSEFYRSTRRRDGYQVWCKTCGSAYQRARRESRLGQIRHRERPDDWIPPVCICDRPGTAQGCGRCRHPLATDMCHQCHRPVGERFAELRAAWRERLGMDP